MKKIFTLIVMAAMVFTFGIGSAFSQQGDAPKADQQQSGSMKCPMMEKGCGKMGKDCPNHADCPNKENCPHMGKGKGHGHGKGAANCPSHQGKTDSTGGDQKPAKQ